MQANSQSEHDVGAAHPPRVLVVEDEVLVRLVIADHLRDAGFVVIEATSGEEARSILDAGVVVDLVFTDVRMPGSMDGLDLLGFIQENRPSLPVLVTSGHLERDLAYARGAARFLPKPYTLEVLVEALYAAGGGSA